MTTKLKVLERIKSLLGQYTYLDQCADELIDAHVAEMAPKCPGIPAHVIRSCEFGAVARGFSRALALEHLRRKLGERTHD
jgi:hypothetical protein